MVLPNPEQIRQSKSDLDRLTKFNFISVFFFFLYFFWGGGVICIGPFTVYTGVKRLYRLLDPELETRSDSGKEILSDSA